MQNELETVSNASSLDTLCDNAVNLIRNSRKAVVQTANIIQVMTYYTLGKWIVEEQQNGQGRAQYGKEVLKKLSARLNEAFENGFSVSTLTNIRKFYLTYSDRISEPVVTKFADKKSQPVVTKLIKDPPFELPWTHYLILMRIEDAAARKFYEIESAKGIWGKRTLQRQVASSLYERIALSRNKDEVMNLANEGNIIAKPEHLMKEPTVLEFLGLEEKDKYTESDLETAIINKIQDFLMEMGKGFLFEKRQKRFTFDEDNYYVDLVLYNRLMRCYVLIDLKTDKLTHQDLGQMQMYVNYYDRYVKQEYENPTVGILLCAEKSDALVELTLPKDANIYAGKYQLYLPDKELLQEKLKEWMREGTSYETSI